MYQGRKELGDCPEVLASFTIKLGRRKEMSSRRWGGSEDPQRCFPAHGCCSSLRCFSRGHSILCRLCADLASAYPYSTYFFREMEWGSPGSKGDRYLLKIRWKLCRQSVSLDALENTSQQSATGRSHMLQTVQAHCVRGSGRVFDRWF